MNNITKNPILTNFMAFVCSILTVCFGPLMPTFQSGEFGSTRINLIWDPLYGIGFAVAYLLFGFRSLKPPFGLFGYLFWPLILFCSIFYLSKKLIDKEMSFRFKIIIALFFLLTFTMNITWDQADNPFFNWLPFFQGYANMAY